MKTTDPLEQQIEAALIAAGLDYRTETEHAARLDFWLPGPAIYIEVKGGHSERTAAQMARVSNVIVAQGDEAVKFLAQAIKAMKGASPACE